MTIAKYHKAYYQKNRTKILLEKKEYNQRKKVIVLTYYGKGGQMLCCWPDCNITDQDILTIDHIADNGASERKTRGIGRKFYQSLIADNYPLGYQTLCWNHQWKKRRMKEKGESFLGDFKTTA